MTLRREGGRGGARAAAATTTTSRGRSTKVHAEEVSEGRHDYDETTSRVEAVISERAENEKRRRRARVLKLTGTGKAPKRKTPEYKKSELRPVLIKNELKVQLVQFTDTQSFTKEPLAS